MINTTDLKMFNETLKKKYSVKIQGCRDKKNKRCWLIKIKRLDDKKEYILHTFAGHIRYFKTLEYCIDFIQNYCTNSKSIEIVLSNDSCFKSGGIKVINNN